MCRKNMFTILFEGNELPAKCRGSIYYDNEVYPIVVLTKAAVP